jgi:hypothetical protein
VQTAARRAWPRGLIFACAAPRDEGVHGRADGAGGEVWPRGDCLGHEGGLAVGVEVDRARGEP